MSPEDMHSNNLLNDMLQQLDAKAPELPRSLSPSRSSLKQQQPTLDEEGIDSGCLPKTRNSAESKSFKKSALNKTNGNTAAAAPESPPTEDEFDLWNRITKEAADWDRKGTEHFEQGDYDQAFLCYEKALTLKRQINTKKNNQTADSPEASLMASVATSINNMTYLKQRSGQATADETMAAYLQSLQMKREILGPNHLSVGKTLNNIGSVFYLQRDFEPALKAYLQAFGIMQEQLGDGHLDVGTVLSNVGDVYFAMKNREEAKEHYRKALDIRWGALGPSDPKVVRLMEQLAFLETGKQPSRDEEDFSDSENEEFAIEDRLRHERFQEEVRVLHDELAEDMKFFDLLERKLAIDMVRDKTRMFRKMRQLTDLSMDELMDVSESTEYSESELALVAIPAMQSLLIDGADAANDQDELDDLPEHGGASGVSDSGKFFTDVHPAGLESSSSATSFLERQAALMTTEERKEALETVRQRLATLRAAREAEREAQDGFDTTNDAAMAGWRAQPESLQAA